MPALPPSNVGLIGALHEEVREVVEAPRARGRASIESVSITGFSTAVDKAARTRKPLRSACFLQ
jgi:hypothetical protein